MAEFVSLEMALPCFITAVISVPLTSLTAMHFLGHTKNLLEQ